MCGRSRLSRRNEIRAQHFDADFDGLDCQPRYNVASDTAGASDPPR